MPNLEFSNLLSYSVLADYYIFLLLEMKIQKTMTGLGSV